LLEDVPKPPAFPSSVDYYCGERALFELQCELPPFITIASYTGYSGEDPEIETGINFIIDTDFGGD